MRPLDIGVLVACLLVERSRAPIQGKEIAALTLISPSEVSESIRRSKASGLLRNTPGARVNRLAFREFLLHGLAYVFPPLLGSTSVGIPTGHSFPAFKGQIRAMQDLVWTTRTGTVRGIAIVPIYPRLPEACALNEDLYATMAAVDMLRIGKPRERIMAIEYLDARLFR